MWRHGGPGLPQRSVCPSPCPCLARGRGLALLKAQVPLRETPSPVLGPWQAPSPAWPRAGPGRLLCKMGLCFPTAWGGVVGTKGRMAGEELVSGCTPMLRLAPTPAPRISGVRLPRGAEDPGTFSRHPGVVMGSSSAPTQGDTPTAGADGLCLATSGPPSGVRPPGLRVLFIFLA